MAEIMSSLDCASVLAQQTGQFDSWAVNANNPKTDFQSYGLQIWHACFQRHSGHDTLNILEKDGARVK